MTQQIISLCQRGVDGIFVTIPSHLVHPAIKECQALNIPVVSINSGAQDALELGLVHHISQLEYEGGFQAGTRMALEGITEAICLFYEAGNSALLERCEGFQAGLKEVSHDIEYLGAFVIAFDSKVLSIEGLEKAVGKEGDWTGLGALSVGAQTVGPLLEVKKLHPKLLFGTFDINNEVYVGIDQNPFMQGYMPVWLLTMMIHTE
jgi:simple sugar transport system substrate-binding protein